MCEGEARKQMLRESYRLGYDAAMREVANANAPVPNNVVDLNARLVPVAERVPNLD